MSLLSNGNLSAKGTQNTYAYQFRIILIGDGNVGKSSLLRQFAERRFIPVSDPTVGVDFHARMVELNDGICIKLQLWDTGGQERFRSITRSYYRNCAGCVIVYDVANRMTFEHVKDWLRDAKENTGEENIVYLLVGHKVDLDRQREVLTSEGEEFARGNGLLFIETSAKVACNIEKAFEMLTREIYRRVKREIIRPSENWDGVKVGRFPSDIVQLKQNGVCTGSDSGSVSGSSWLEEQKCCNLI